MGDATAGVSLPRFQGQLLRQSAAKSVVLLFSGQFDCYEAEESPVERAWFKLEKYFARACSSALSYLLLDANLSSLAAAARAIKMQGIPACCGNGKEVANPGIKTWL